MGQNDKYYSKLNRHFVNCVRKNLNVILFHDEMQYLASDTFFMVVIPPCRVYEVFNNRMIFPDLPETGEVYTYRSYAAGEIKVDKNKISKDWVLDIYCEAVKGAKHMIIPTGWTRNNSMLFKEIDSNVPRIRLINMSILNLFATKTKLTYYTDLNYEHAPVVITENGEPIGVVMPLVSSEIHDLQILKIPDSKSKMDRVIENLYDIIAELTSELAPKN